MIVACYVISATRYYGLASGRGNKLFIAAVVGLGSSLPVMRLVREVCYKCSRLSIYILYFARKRMVVKINIKLI